MKGICAALTIFFLSAGLSAGTVSLQACEQAEGIREAAAVPGEAAPGNTAAAGSLAALQDPGWLSAAKESCLVTLQDTGWLSAAEESCLVTLQDTGWLSAEEMLYGRPGSDFGKGHRYTYAAEAVFSDLPSLLPARFSWADHGKKPAVRSQGSLGTCWALAAAEALEASLRPGQEIEFSADHISMQNGFDAGQDDGGDYSMIMSYLADDKGPVTEEEDPYGDGISPEGLKPAARASEMRLLRGMSQEEIRSMIYRYGPVQSSLTMDRAHTDDPRRAYYNEKTSGYFDPMTEKLDHDILVLGWDDTYPKENFLIRPEEDGAWICQNTWGSGFGEDGIFYVSYEDRNLFRKGGIAYTDVQPAEAAKDRHVLEQDRLGWQARQGYGSPEAYFAGVFVSDLDQTIEAVGLYSVGNATTVSIFLVPDFESGKDLVLPKGDRTSCGQRSIALATAYLETPGFYTVNAERAVRLAAGEKFAVIVRIFSPGQDKPVAVEVKKDRYTQNVSTKGRESYISPDGHSWERTQDAYGTNVCMKIYTACS